MGRDEKSNTRRYYAGGDIKLSIRDAVFHLSNYSRIWEHPEVFGVYPRIDIIHDNLEWQRKYNVVNYAHCKSVHEMIYMYGGGAKPWPQKGTGRARQGSTRAPQWVEE